MIGSATPHAVVSPRKRVHHWVWTVLVGLVAGIGGAIAILDQGLSMTVGFGLGCTAVVLALNVNVTRAAMRPRPVLIRGLIGGLAGMCWLGWFALLGSMTVWLVAAVVVSSPWVFDRCQMGLAGHLTAKSSLVETGQTRRSGDADGLADPDSPRSVRAMSDGELCLAWQISTFALTEMQHRGDIANQSAMISLRQSYLDEFSTRYQAGFQDWLSAGAWPGGDPPGQLM